MNNNSVMLKPVKELCGMNFFIPDYQRGYRWEKQQALDLLEDIWNFAQDDKKSPSEIYCIQPLVVQRKNNNIEEIKKNIQNAEKIEDIEKALVSAWNVVDGQQRLTTIFLILSALEENEAYTIEYQTRAGTWNFLKNIKEAEKDKNIDFYHIYLVHNTIKKWFDDKDDVSKRKFKETLLEKVNFIWYQIIDENQDLSHKEAIATFTRLNIGKIPLTDSELIKALFLNRSYSNLSNIDSEKQQLEIALEWDKIEYTLQNDEFWLFIHEPMYTKPTRIDFILDMVSKDDKLTLKKQEKGLKKENKERAQSHNKSVNEAIGHDEHSTFRYFHYYFTKSPKSSKDWLSDTWKIVSDYFRVFNEWYNDYRMYHYVGYLSCFNDSSNLINDLVNAWPNNTKDSFVEKVLKEKICDTLTKFGNKNAFIDLENFKYDTEDGNTKKVDKSKCVPILLLHNVETVIQQSNKLSVYHKYSLPIFSKFPFHLYKKENWNVEHIRPNAGDNLKDDKTKELYLCIAKKYIGYSRPDLRNEIENFLSCNENKTDFSDLQAKIIEEEGALQDSDKNKIWNFTLLDESTNKEYGNMIFPIKRAFVANKENGYKIKYEIKNGALEESSIHNEIAFVPPCTKNVFAKFYTTVPTTIVAWTKEDAKAYLADIKIKLDFYINRISGGKK